MPSWLLKAGIQGVISLLPNSRRVNYLFQHNVSKGLQLSEPYFEEKLKICTQHIANYRSVKQAPSALSKNVLEIGTGWLPIVPIGLFLCGIDDAVLENLLRAEIHLWSFKKAHKKISYSIEPVSHHFLQA
jgi:hypothetical protein